MNDEHRSYIDQSDAHISQLEAHVRTVETELAAAIKRAEQAEADRDAARKLCEDDMTWMHDERCSACGHRLRFSASHCPQCRAPGVPDWKLPKELPDICECGRCVDARSALGRAK